MEQYQNPVYGHNFPDPFVLKFRGEYWAYATGIQPDGRCFGILHSHDLQTWEEIGGALDPLEAGWPQYWAPEVTYDNGRFFMYYSVGDEEHMEIRVAVAEHPGGPFVDSGHRLTSEPFAIDAHVLVDDDGSRYLFYATDFLQHTHIGTGTVRDKLVDAFTLAGNPQPVTRARYDWQVYDPQRASKGGVRWHTIEGPFVLKRKGSYYQMFSGGNWQHPSYGVSYAIATDLAAQGEWSQVADGEQVLPILRTEPGVNGPGHNSAVRGPDNRQLYCVYHFWPEDKRGRVMAIDPLEWSGERMLLVGPSITPRPAPIKPSFVDLFDQSGEGLGDGWAETGGRWSRMDRSLVQAESEGEAKATCPAAFHAAVVEVYARSIAYADGGSYGLVCSHEGAEVLQVLLQPVVNQLVVRRSVDGVWRESPLALTNRFAPSAEHLLRIDLGHGWAEITLDERVVWRGPVAPIDRIALATHDAAAAFASFELTLGWQDLFDTSATRPEDLGWEPSAAGVWRLEDHQLVAAPADEALIVKGAPAEDYELVVNVQLVAEDPSGASYGIDPAYDQAAGVAPFRVEQDGNGWTLTSPGAASAITLPETFDPFEFQQFRFRRQGGQIAVQWERYELGVFAAPGGQASVALSAHNAEVRVDMVRVTALS